MKRLKSQSACALLKVGCKVCHSPSGCYNTRIKLLVLEHWHMAHRLQRLLKHSDQAPGAYFSSGLVSSTWWYPQLRGSTGPRSLRRGSRAG
jgi:hypothetical protein